MDHNNITRQKYIDYTKGFGILVIVFAHCAQCFAAMQGVNAFVCSFHVPLFFVVAGILSNYTFPRYASVKEFLRRRVRALLIPYIIFSIINSALKLSVLGIRGLITKDIFISESVELLITGNGTVWFLMTLFFTELINYTIRKLNYYIRFLIMVICLVLPYFIRPFFILPLYIFVIRIIAATGYYLFGCLIFDLISTIKKDAYIIIAGVLLMVAGVAAFLCLGSEYAFFDGYFKNPAGSLLCSLSLSCGFILLFCYIEKTNMALRILDHFGRNSIIVLLVHPIVLLCFTYPLGDFFVTLSGIRGVVFSLILWLFILLLMIPAIWIINNWIPWCIGKK